MKTSMKQLTAGALLAFLLVVGNVKAEGTEIKSPSSLEAIETKLEIENWMMDESIWKDTPFVMMEQETEESMELENWMTNENTWNSEFEADNAMKTEKESKLQLESWMTAESLWNK